MGSAIMRASWSLAVLGFSSVCTAGALSLGHRCDGTLPSIRVAHCSPSVAPLQGRTASAVAAAAALLHSDVVYAATSKDNVYAATPDFDGFLIGFAGFLVVATGLLQLSLGDIQAEEANLPSSVSLINKNRQKTNSFIKSKK